MPLESRLFTQPADQRLEGCLVEDSQHIVQGTIGDHVKKVQAALNTLSAGAGRENFQLDVDGVYGPLTADAVRTYKSAPQRRILGPGQLTPDDIVGKLTIKSLDDEMAIEEEESSSQSSLIASDFFGASHDHSKCPPPSVNGEIEINPIDKTMSHFGTPMNPLGFGRKINIGGRFESSYLGFIDTVPDPKLDRDFSADLVQGRMLTSSLARHSVSDICFRSAPIDAFMKVQIPIICMRGARLTFVGQAANPDDLDEGLNPYFRSIGIIVQSGQLIEKSGQLPHQDRFFVIVSVLNVASP
jgi:hypothetical protein